METGRINIEDGEEAGTEMKDDEEKFEPNTESDLTKRVE